MRPTPYRALRNVAALLGRVLVAVLALSAATHRVTAQAIPKPDYVTYLSRETVLPIQGTVGNQQFQLYGDPAAAGFRDEDPRNGIDDARERWLRTLAVRFAPWMVRNSVDFPMDFRRFVEGGEASSTSVQGSSSSPREV